MTAPEKIAIKPCSPCNGDGDWYVALTKGGTEYTRSDLIVARIAAALERGRIAGLREAAEIADAHYAAGDMGNPGHHILARIPTTQSDEASK